MYDMRVFNPASQALPTFEIMQMLTLCFTYYKYFSFEEIKYGRQVPSQRSAQPPNPYLPFQRSISIVLKFAYNIAQAYFYIVK